MNLTQSNGIAEAKQDRLPLIAPIWHTLTLIAGLIAISAFGAYLVRSAHPLTGSQRLFRYGVMIALEWAMVAYIAWGMKGRVAVAGLLCGDWKRPQHVLRDVGIAVTFLLAAYCVMFVLLLLLRPGHSVGVERLMPHTRSELWLFIAVALTAGFVEEIVFRGYLQRQLLALFGNENLSIVLQAIVFGAAHGYQGSARMQMLGSLGLLLGLLAKWRKSLRPGMIAHAALDMLAGVAFFVRH